MFGLLGWTQPQPGHCARLKWMDHYLVWGFMEKEYRIPSVEQDEVREEKGKKNNNKKGLRPVWTLETAGKRAQEKQRSRTFGCK